MEDCSLAFKTGDTSSNMKPRTRTYSPLTLAVEIRMSTSFSTLSTTNLQHLNHNTRDGAV